jgi:hypothetical protein
MTVPSTDLSRRSWLSRAAGLGAAVGASALGAGCLETALAPIDETSDEELALDGAPVGWADAIGTPLEPLDLRTMTPGAYAVVIAKGFREVADGGGGVFGWSSDTDTADDVGRVVVPTAVPRTGCWKRVETPVLDVRWFGARGDGRSDDLAAIQQAVTIASAGGGIVYLPPGRYATTGSISIAASNVVLRGEGNASVIVPTGSFDTIVVRPATAGTFLLDVRVLDVVLDEAGKTGGRSLDATLAVHFVAQRLHGRGGHRGLSFTSCTNVTLDQVNLAEYRGSDSAYLRIVGGIAPDYRSSSAVRVRQSYFGGSAANGLKGIDIDGDVAIVELFGVRVSRAGAEAVHVRNGVGAARGPSRLTAHTLMCDGPQAECVRLDQVDTCTLVGASLVGSRSAANLHIGPSCRSITVTGGSSSGAQRAGIDIAAIDVNVSQMTFQANSSDAAPGGLRDSYPGIVIRAAARAVTVTGCRSGAVATASFQRYGIAIEAGADQFAVVGNVFTNNVRAGIDNRGGATTQRVVTGNAA